MSQDEIEEKSMRFGIDIKNTSATMKLNIDESINNFIEKIIKSVYANEISQAEASIELRNYSRSESLSRICKSG